MSTHKNKPAEGEIVTPEMLNRVLGKQAMPELPQLDLILERFDDLLRQSLEVLDLNKEEGWLGEFWRGLDYRIDKKTERGQAMFGLLDVFMQNLDRFEEIEKKIRAISREQYERQIDRIRAARTALEERIKLDAVAADAALQRQIEVAKAEAEIAKQKRIARDLLTEPLPPAPAPAPPPSPATPEQRRANKKLTLQLELDRLKKEEKAELEKLAAGKPQGQLTDDVQEEIKRTVNMYFHAKEKVREEMRKCL